jgi:hypothetical protein
MRFRATIQLSALGRAEGSKAPTTDDWPQADH